MNFLCLCASFYVALYPVGGPYLEASTFFQGYLAAPFLLFLYLCWKLWSWFKHPAHRPLYVRIADIDIYTGMRTTGESHQEWHITELQQRQSISETQQNQKRRGFGDWAKAAFTSVI